VNKYQLGVKARVSVLYHRRRQAFFERWDAISKVLGIATAAFVVYGEKHGIPFMGYWTAVTTAIVTTLVVVGGASRKAVQHSVLATRWVSAHSEMVDVADEPNALAPTERRFMEIKRDELPELGALIRLCQREVMRADGHPESELPNVPPLHRLLASWIDFQTPPAKE
jgi:hypothetical protein